MSNAMQDYLTQAAQRLRLSVDAQSGILFGNQGGMNMLLTRGTSNQNYVSLVFSLTRGGQEPDGAELKSFVKGNKLVANCTVRRSRVEFILKARFGSMKDIDKLEQVTRETVSFLRSRGYQSCCQGCGQTGACGLRLRLIVTVKLHGLPPPQIVLSIFTIAHSTIFFIYRQIALRMQNGP